MIRTMLKLLLMLSLAVPVFPVQSAAPGRPLAAGDELWSNNFGPNGTNSYVTDIAVDGTKIYVAGAFSQAGGVPAARIAMWDGMQWSDLNAGNFTGTINDLLVGPTGILYATGSFSSIGGVSANNIAQYLAGAWWPVGSGLTGAGQTLEMNGIELMVGGSFTAAGGDTTIRREALWDGVSWKQYSAAFPTSIGTVYDLLPWRGKMFAGTSSGLVYYDNGAWVVSQSVGAIETLATDGNFLYAAGSFNTIGGTTISRVASWNGTSWFALGAGLNATVYSLYFDGARGLVAAGSFTGSGATALNYAAHWDGSAWQPFAMGATQGTNGTVYDVMHYGGDRLLFGGNFTLAGGIACNHLAMYTGQQWQGVAGDGMVMSNEFVHAFATDGAGNLYAGVEGYATTGMTMGGIAADYIARWDGSAWHALPGGGVNGAVLALAYDPTHGALYAGGRFTSAGGNPAQHVARWNGAAWEALGSGINGDVNALAVDSLGNLVAGGNFTTAGGLTVPGLARWVWQADGSGAWEGNITDLVSTQRVNALVMDRQDQWYAGGPLTFGGDASQFADLIRCWGISCRGIGRSGTTGQQPGVFGEIVALAYDGLDNLYIADYTHVAKVFVDGNGVAQWQSIGQPFSAASVTYIRALSLDRANTLYVAGWFSSTGSVSANSVVRWDGTDWQPLGSGLQMTLTSTAAGDVNALAVVQDALYVGGHFQKAGGKPSFNIARYTLPAPPANQAPVVQNWQKQGTTDQTLQIGSGPFFRSYTDPERDPLASIQLFALPAHGQLLVSGSPVSVGQVIPAAALPTAQFVPEAGWSGQTSFTYQASDGSSSSAQSAFATLSFEQTQPCTLAGTVITTTRALSPAECDPYIVQGNLIVNQGATLSLAPGTRLRFDGAYTFTINGQLLSQGTPAQPVLWTSNRADPAPGDWGGINFGSMSDDAVFDAAGIYRSGSILQDNVIEYAGSTPVNSSIQSSAVFLNAAAPYFEHNQVRYSAGSGIYGIGFVESDFLRLRGNRISWNAREGLHLGVTNTKQDGRFELSANQFLSNGLKGLYLDGDWASVLENTASYNGLDGIYALMLNDRTLTTAATQITGSQFIQNGGMGITGWGMQFDITNNLIQGNRGDYAGGIYINDCVINWCSYTPQVSILNNSILDNQAWRSTGSLGAGGVLVQGGGVLTIRGNLIRGNHMWTANKPGGGLTVDGGSQIFIEQNRIEDNTSAGDGAGIYLNSSTATCPTCFRLRQNILSGNIAAGKGGGITWSSTFPDFSFDHNTFQGNQAALGSAVYNSRPTASSPILAAQNDWGTSDLAQVEEQIYHFNDNAGLGLVNYNPVLNGPIQLTATLTANFTRVQPGSRINLTLRGVPANAPYTVLVNGAAVGSLTSDANGQILFTLVTAPQAANGTYVISLVPVGTLRPLAPSTTVTASLPIQLSDQAPVQTQAADLGPTLSLPGVVTPNFILHLPFLLR